MKFGATFQEALQRDEYPKEWIDSAISYKKLKKCIKCVQQELQSLGLDHDTLERLWQQVGDATPSHLSTPNANGFAEDRIMHYDFSKKNDSRFIPKLTIALDPRDGSPMDAWLSPETRKVLIRLSKRRASLPLGLEDPVVAEVNDSDVSPDGSRAVSSPALELSQDHDEDQNHEIETVEIPLTSDSEFFQILRKELRSLETLQKSEQKHIEQEIVQLGEGLRDLKESHRKRSREEIEAWREIFRLYLDSQVFLSSHEQDAGARDAAHAQKQLKLFDKALNSEQGTKIRLSKDAMVALERFRSINLDLLRLLKYQEINSTALTKILKKFDKRTALHVQQPVLEEMQKSQNFMTQDLAKATCFMISEELLKIIPQVNDYLCPVCFSISYKPVRLRCNHVFCIRCLVVMQRAEQDNCPLCREPVVLEATGENLDNSLKLFLKKNFPQEVKAKQKENEIAAGVDRFGEGFDGNHKCVVM